MGERTRSRGRPVCWTFLLNDTTEGLMINPLRVADIEKQIGAGLIEEVIQVAEGELSLVDEMHKSQA